MENRTRHMLAKERQTERGILLIYSLYTIGMMIVSAFLNWGLWVLPVIFLGMAGSWYLYAIKFRTYWDRAFILSAAALMNFFIYGINAESFFGILSTMSALVILLAIYNIKEIMYMAAGVSLLLLFYHGVIIRTIHMPQNVSETVRMVLQIVSIFTVECITYYLVKTQIEVKEQLMETIDTLTQAEKSKDDFVSNVSHEIRTPINVISGISEMLLNNTLPEEARENVQDIQMASRNLLGIVSDILDFSELQSGKIELVEEEYNITSTVNDVLNMAMAKRGEKSIDFLVDCDANIPCAILGDEQKVHRVMMNIVNNAVKFTNEGCIYLTVRARRENYGINLVVSVKDTGIGIQEANLEKIYSNFNQVDMKKNRQESGIGLGLAIARALVQKMGGFISIRSTYGSGTETKFVIPQKVLNEQPMIAVHAPERIHALFYINVDKYSLPALREGYETCCRNMAEQLGIHYRLCKSLAEMKRRIEEKSYTHVFVGYEEYREDAAFFEKTAGTCRVSVMVEQGAEEKIDGRIQQIEKPLYTLNLAAVLNSNKILLHNDDLYGLNNRFEAPETRVLAVDDNLMNLKVVMGLLKPYKIQIFTAKSGQEALTKIASRDYDFVFMDHMMPGMDGIETVRQIRQKPGKYFQEVPIIALTANAIGGARELFLSEGFQDFLAKPIEQSSLERILRKYVPEEKVIKKEYQNVQEETSRLSDPNLANLQIKGVDVEQGVCYSGGRTEDYLDILNVYLLTGRKNLTNLRKLFAQRDWHEYEIWVHAVKSTSYGIGAKELGDEAMALESAAKGLDENYILNNHEHLMRAYETLLEDLERNPQIQQTKVPDLKSQQEVDEVTLHQQLTQLKEKLDTFESEEVEQILTQMSSCQYEGKSVGVWLQPVKEKVREFDFLGAAKELEQIQEKMR